MVPAGNGRYVEGPLQAAPSQSQRTTAALRGPVSALPALRGPQSSLRGPQATVPPRPTVSLMHRTQGDIDGLIGGYHALNQQGVHPQDIDNYLTAQGVPASEFKLFHDANAYTDSTPGFVRSMSNGFAFNLSDEAAGLDAATQTAVHNGLAKMGLMQASGYSPADARAFTTMTERSADHRFQRDHPGWNLVGAGIGGYANPVGRLGGGWIGEAKGLAALGRSALVGGGMGAAYGAGEGDTLEARLSNAGTGALSGATLGTVLPGAAQALGAAKTAVLGPVLDSMVSPDVLDAARRSAIQKADALGLKYDPDAINRLIGKVGDTVKQASVNAVRHPFVTSWLDDINGMASKWTSPQTLEDAYSQLVRDVQDTKSKTEQDVLGKIGDHFLEALHTETPQAPDGVDPARVQQATQTLSDTNRAHAKIIAIQDAVNAAKAAAEKNKTAWQSELRGPLKAVQDRFGDWSQVEQDAFHRVMQNPTTQVMTQAGKFAPGDNIFAKLATGFIGTKTGVPIGTLLDAAKQAAPKLATRNIAQLEQAVSQQGATAQQLRAAAAELGRIPPSARRSALQALLARRLAGLRDYTGYPTLTAAGAVQGNATDQARAQARQAALAPKGAKLPTP